MQKASRRHEVMRSFWDEKARENPMYYISSYRPYDDQDTGEFWKWGDILANRFLDESEISFTGDESVLEIGCGIGRMTKTFARRFRHVVGIDVSEEMIALARENLKDFSNVVLDIGNGYDLSNYHDKMFNFIFSYITFQHIPDRAIAKNYIVEAGRVLKAGGYFYFQCNNKPTRLRERLRLGRLKTLGRKLRGNRNIIKNCDARGPKDLDNPAWQGSHLTVREIRKACRDGALTILGLSGQGSQYLWVKAQKSK